MSSVASGPGTSGTSSSTAVSSDPAGVTTSNRRVLTGERSAFCDFIVPAATFGLATLGVGEGAGLVVRWERRVAPGPRGDFIGELAATEGVLAGAGEAS